MHINSELIKKLRLKSGIGIMECKKALLLANGDIQKAIFILKKNGNIKAENKIKNIALRGIISTSINNGYSCILELNCETDFVEKHIDFIKFSKEILLIAYNQQIKDLLNLRKIFEEQRIMLVSKFSENIIIRRFQAFFSNKITSYVHRNRIGVLVESNFKNKDNIKKIAMHIAANNPDYLSRNDIPSEVIKKEKKIQLEIALSSGKPLSIAKKIVDGRMEKFFKKICLLEQQCVFNIEKKIKDFIFENNGKIFNFIRFELGEEF
ncbi:translation elongation factor Ts [Buchnera aphidicola]|uniref:Elongation factor Ts n=1 Tax=Buchnera aphidicola (Therioaphis trifolii) TaxID=1241884 RepID=A0A4D6YMV1_9GAMM|nr:translation elongation factor Ts [Buchnera aphidicola]QCI27158.1 elongation factor Ts [Buchnera aphidicola (Therioaphis trifolii)]